MTKDWNLSEEEWKKLLTEDEYYVLRKKGTERPFTGLYDTHFEKGTYYCKGCKSPLFESNAKFNSGCGWPAFDAPSAKMAVKEHVDKSHGMTRIEITCNNCGGHLGHVFTDGPTTTGLRYCINSISLEFKKEP